MRKTKQRTERLLSRKEELTCLTCGSGFHRPPSAKAKFCSKDCYSADQKANSYPGRFQEGHAPVNGGNWRGDEVGYYGIHSWVQKELGSPSECADCGDTSPRRYEWANISREYKRDINDWKRLCRPCHHKFDSISEKVWATREINGTARGWEIEKKTHCKRGHEYNEIDTYYYKGTPFCIKCRRIREESYA